MELQWLFFALLTPVLWSAVVFVDDSLLRNVYRSPSVGVIISGLFGLLPLVSLYWLDLQTIPPLIAGIAMVSGVLTIMNYYFYFRALEKEAPSIVIAMFSLTPAIVPFLAFALLGETLTQQQILGFIIILMFTFMLAVIDVKKLKFSKALLPVILASILVAFALIAGKFVYERVDFYTGYMYYSIGVGIGTLPFLYMKLMMTEKLKKRKKIPKKSLLIIPLVLVGSELINLAAELSSNIAISLGPVSLVEVIQNTQPMYMLVIALLLYPFFPKYFREAKDGRVKFKLLMMLGIICGLAVTITG